MSQQLDFLSELIDFIFLDQVNVLFDSICQFLLIDEWLVLCFHFMIDIFWIDFIL